jgi:flavodoxin
MKVLIVFESRYGNTKRVAEAIVEGMQQVEGMKTVLSEVKGVDLTAIPSYDAIVIGGPNHMGGPTRGVKKFIDKLGTLPLEGKWFAAFDTYGGRDFEKATKKMEQRILAKAPKLKIIAPGLSIQVQGMKGPITEGELPKCREFGTAIAAKLAASS